jgi:multimeric flavodoxin WrbA
MILGLNSSPRRGGNSDTLLDRFLEGCSDQGTAVEKITIEGLDISLCSESEYFKCDKRGYSPVKDDMELIYPKVEQAVGIVVASPVFFGSVPAQLKKVIDRFQSVWVAREMKKMKVFDKRKKAAFLCVSASNRVKFFEDSRSVVRNFFATINAETSCELYVPGFEKKAEVASSVEQMGRMFEAGRSFAAGCALTEAE